MISSIAVSVWYVFQRTLKHSCSQTLRHRRILFSLRGNAGFVPIEPVADACRATNSDRDFQPFQFKNQKRRVYSGQEFYPVGAMRYLSSGNAYRMV